MTSTTSAPNGRGLSVRSGQPSSAAIEKIFLKNYVRYQYCFVDFFAEHLSDVSREFKGDLQMAVLLAIIGQVTLQATIAAQATGREILDLPAERRGITTFRLADSTSIPRETVRRKLTGLAKKGWIQREGNFWVMPFRNGDSIARHELTDIDQRSMARAARLYAAISALVAADAS